MWNQPMASWCATCTENWWSQSMKAAWPMRTWSGFWTGCPNCGIICTPSWRSTAPLTFLSVWNPHDMTSEMLVCASSLAKNGKPIRGNTSNDTKLHYFTFIIIHFTNFTFLFFCTYFWFHILFTARYLYSLFLFFHFSIVFFMFFS